MNTSHLRALEASQSGIAKKVLENVPVDGTTNRSKLMADFSRMGSRPDPRVIDGCLNSLAGSGLIKEVSLNHYRRIAAKEQRPMPAHRPTEPVHELVDLAVVAAPRLAKKVNPDPLESFSAIATDLRRMAREFGALADRVETAALAADAKASEASEATEQLRQLRALLKGIGE